MCIQGQIIPDLTILLGKKIQDNVAITGTQSLS